MGYGYGDAVDYWRRMGFPLRMDADRNGIPCETVYDSEEVLTFLGGSLPESVTFNAGEWVGRTVELGHDGFVRVEHEGSTFELRDLSGPLYMGDTSVEASGWFVARESIDWWAPTEPAEVMFWVVDSWEDHGTILAALGLRLTPDRPLDFCFRSLKSQGNDVAWWVGPTHTWNVDEAPTYFQRVDHNSFECSAG